MIPGPARGARSRRRVEQAFEQLLPRCAARPPFACGVSAHRARTSHAPILERAIYFRPCMMAAHVCVPPSRSCAAGWVCLGCADRIRRVACGRSGALRASGGEAFAGVTRRPPSSFTRRSTAQFASPPPGTTACAMGCGCMEAVAAAVGGYRGHMWPS